MPGTTNISSRNVAGIDRWRGGWIIATYDGETVTLSAAADASDARSQTTGCTVVAVDMPMALPTTGQRVAEQELRGALGSSARSVFTSPTRAAIAAETQNEATAINRAHDGPGISAQAWGLAGSIRELRSAIGSHPAASTWCETHPETAFALLNGGPPLASKRSAQGVGNRLRLLRSFVHDLDDVLCTAPAKVPVDDVLDAIAALWSAGRIADGTHRVFGPTGRDDQGFEQSIRV
jgi:predicted RNase H-like nuclease